MKTVGLFAGIGGLERGFEAADFEPTAMCEIDPLCQTVLRKRYPNAKIFGDIADIERLPRADAILAGFPCQPYSQVGLTRGLRDGGKHLQHIFRLLDSTRTRAPYVVLENVPFFVHLDGGEALEHLLRNLERRGYLWAYRIIDAACFGRPQRRRRWILVASRAADPAAILLAQSAQRRGAAEVHANGFYWTEGNRGIGWAEDAIPPLKPGSLWGIAAPPAIWDHSDNAIVVPDVRDAERLQGFTAGWTDLGAARHTREYRQRWRMVGNAVSVPVARWVANRIKLAPDVEVLGERLGVGKFSKAAFFDGRHRFAVDVGEYPVARATTPILDFLSYEPTPLSLRATRGFRRRYEDSPLRKDDAFISALRHHERYYATS